LEKPRENNESSRPMKKKLFRKIEGASMRFWKDGEIRPLFLGNSGRPATL